MHEGFIISVPSKGYFVAEINKEVIREEILNKIGTLLEEAVNIASLNNIDKKTIIEILNILYEEEK